MRYDSQAFATAFANSFTKVRGMYSDADWQRVWSDGDAWNRLMLWKPSPPQQQPLLEIVAGEMGLQYPGTGEPFRVDAAFVDKDRRQLGSVPFPVIVAIEHENKVGTIEEESAKLVHIRCPLKVAITYALLDLAATSERVTRCQEQIRTSAAALGAKLDQYVTEDPRTSYLYLLGVESRPRELEWRVLQFSASAGPNAASWQVLTA